jgi:hypothetical protein
MKGFKFLISLYLMLSFPLIAQTLVEDATKPLEMENTPGLFTETIKIISGSKKIFILTNNNQQLGQGDFISFVVDGKLAARALVAKNHQGNAGVKIIKIYSLALWSKLHREMEVQILRGDDSSFGKKAVEVAEVKPAEATPKIESEDDLFNSKGVEDIGELNENGLRHIKPDNIISVMLGSYTATNVNRDQVGELGNQFAGAWAYQFTDNYFAEIYYANVKLKDFPSGAGSSGSPGINTNVAITSFRLKYNIKAPFYSFFLPYVGYRLTQVDSPNAGDANAPDPEGETNKIREIKKNGPVFGVTILRRLVPGWFLRADLGTDSGINLGVGIEF